MAHGRYVSACVKVASDGFPPKKASTISKESFAPPLLRMVCLYISPISRDRGVL